MKARARTRPKSASPPARAELEDTLAQALRRLLDNDQHLIAGDASKHSLTFRIGQYLQALLPDWQVDCAYTIDGHTFSPAGPADLVVHRRGTSDNLLVIEVKKSSDLRPIINETRKLESFAKPPLRYRHAVLVIVTTDDSLVVPYELCWVSGE